MALFLITEAEDFRKVDTLIEAVKQNDGTTAKQYYIQGPFIQCNVKNRNGRNYSLQLMQACVDEYKKDRMNAQEGIRSFGELGHPDGVEINMDRVCHYTTALDWQGDDCIGKAKILIAHPMGRILQTFIDDNLRTGVSTRGLGSLSEEEGPNGKNVDSYKMVAIDSVADPSAPKGYVNGILENKQYIIQNDGVILECYNQLERKVSVLPRKLNERAELFINAVEGFLDGVKKVTKK